MEEEKLNVESDGTRTSDVPPAPVEQAEQEHSKEENTTQSSAATAASDKPEQDTGPEATGTETRDEEWVTGPKLAVIIAAITMAAFIMLLDTSIVATAIPRITSDFHSLEDIGWYGSAYLLANCSLQPMTGKIYSRFDSKFTFMFFLALFELGSLLSAVATSSKMFIVARAVSGMGGSGIVNGALTILACCIPMEKRAAYMGVMMGTAQLGIMFGPLLGGALTEYASWRWCFYINLPIGGLTVLFLFFIYIPSHTTRTTRTTIAATSRETLRSFDLLGFTFFAPFAIMFLLALEWGGTTYPWHSATIIGLFCGSGGVLLVFLAWEYFRGDEAMIPLPMVRRKVIATSCLAMFFAAANMMTTSYYMAIYFQADRGVSPMLSGVYMLPNILSQMVFGILSGALISRLGYYLPSIVVGTILCSIGTGLISTLNSTSVTGKWVGYQILSGLGRGCTIQIPLLAIQNNLAPSQIPVGMSLVVFCQTFGAALFLSFSQTIFSTTLSHQLPITAPDVNAQAVINAGASLFRDVVPKALLPGVLLAYDKAIDRVFYLASGCAVAAFVVCWGMGWKSVKKAKVVMPEA